jgi:hydrogenase expression/formation protein HypE
MIDKELVPGKLPPELLDRLLASTSKAPEILVGAVSGEDAAVVRGEAKLILTADPITFTEEDIGTYTVAVNANDIVAMGGIPVYLTTTILCPPGCTSGRLETVFRDIRCACEPAGILWIGGHTEVTSAVTRIVVSAQAVGFLRKEATETSAARPGQWLMMTKYAALEATTLMAREKPEQARRLLGDRAYENVLGWLYDPGISILKEGRILSDAVISAAHDPTEGGIATGIHEIAGRSGVGIRLFYDRIIIKPETLRLCAHFGLDPLGALSSGVFLFTALPAEAERACAALVEQGLPAAVIGEVTADRGKVLIEKDGRILPLPVFRRDEILKLNGTD